MKRRILAAVSAVVVFSLVSAASAEDTFTRVWTDWYRGTPGFTYTGVDADGNPVTIKGDGTEYVTVTNVIWNQSFSGSKLSFYGICLKALAGNGYSESYDPMVLGAGGFSIVTANEHYSFATRTTG